MAGLPSFFSELTRSFRIADAVDIALISLFLYAVLVWFRETTSRRMLVGILVLVVVYFAARHFELYMTSQLLHAGFTVVLIVLVVIFQEDLRRVFERIATLGSFTESSSDVKAGTYNFDILVEIAFELASKKHGALVAIPGNDPISRHIHGGVALSGKLSRPLLDSLFDPSSAGHDGAVLIESGLVSRFAVHLPLSKNRNQVRSLGTRHAAALGLSERTDAIIIVVSEERGVVSLAEGGKLTVVNSAASLKQRLDAFVDDKFPASKETFWNHVVVKNWPSKLLSTALAMLAWLLLAYNPSTVQRTFVVPIEYRNVPTQLEISGSAPTETRVTLSGTEPAFRLLDPAALKIAINLGNATAGSRVISVEPRKNLTVPANLTVYRIEHASILLFLSDRETSQAIPP